MMVYSESLILQTGYPPQSWRESCDESEIVAGIGGLVDPPLASHADAADELKHSPYRQFRDLKTNVHVQSYVTVGRTSSGTVLVRYLNWYGTLYGLRYGTVNYGTVHRKRTYRGTVVPYVVRTVLVSTGAYLYYIICVK